VRRLWVMTLSDLRQRIRDRSVLIFALVVPLALMFVFNLIFGGVTDLELEPVSVAVSAFPYERNGNFIGGTDRSRVGEWSAGCSAGRQLTIQQASRCPLP
jgi:hypothetical protein